MLLRFKAETWERLAYERDFTGGLPASVVMAYREKIQVLRAAPQADVLRALSAWLRFRDPNPGEKHHAIQVMNGWELILEFEDADGATTAVIETMVQLVKTTTTTREHRL